MRRLIGTLLFTWYTLGVFILGGDFTLVGDLGGMYAHCKATEDKDMNWIDFVTDHLVNFDSLTDGHPPGDDQRPHRPYHPQHHTGAQEVLPLTRPVVAGTALLFTPTELLRGDEGNTYHFDPLVFVFRPPMA